VISVGCWGKHNRVGRDSSALIIRGRVERAMGVTNLVADCLERLSLAGKIELARIPIELSGNELT
jgi:error-prone DNA polymerase